jgi:type II secretory pathway pseudopilin PulG
MDSPFAVLLGILLLVAIAIMVRRRKARELQQAYNKYQRALEVLKLRPTDPQLKQQALQLGRYYSTLTRQRRGVTVYDELAVMNDISAATAGASNPQYSAPLISQSASIEERMVKLNDLRRKGIISEDEYTAKRKQILEDI